MKCSILFLLLMVFQGVASLAQITEIVILDNQEIKNLRELTYNNAAAQRFGDSIVLVAERSLNDSPKPIRKIFYEGLLDSNPARIETVGCLEDMNKVADLIYASYIRDSRLFSEKAKAFVLAWANTYIPTGNPINENKLSALFWAYHRFKPDFSTAEKQLTEDWMVKIAQAQMDRQSTPNNNWEAKRLKIIGITGCITENTEMKEYAADGFRNYISSAYYEDGTSNDLRDRDALHYHIGGLTPTVATFITLAKFDPLFDLYHYIAPSGSSIKKSVEYTWPYASGRKQRGEWTNSKVKLDKERAASGLEKYQPGRLFDPREAIPLFEWAGYYHPEWYSLFGKNSTGKNYLATWTGLLNCPLVRISRND
ncbi:MAG: alginate lyase family protein [Bacteroidota bacterium]